MGHHQIQQQRGLAHRRLATLLPQHRRQHRLRPARCTPPLPHFFSPIFNLRCRRITSSAGKPTPCKKPWTQTAALPLTAAGSRARTSLRRISAISRRRSRRTTIAVSFAIFAPVVFLRVGLMSIGLTQLPGVQMQAIPFAA